MTPEAHRALVLAYCAKTEPNRHASEVRTVAGWTDPEGFPDYERMQAHFDAIGQPRELGGRGPEAAVRLREDVRTELRRRKRPGQPSVKDAGQPTANLSTEAA